MADSKITRGLVGDLTEAHGAHLARTAYLEGVIAGTLGTMQSDLETIKTAVTGGNGAASKDEDSGIEARLSREDSVRVGKWIVAVLLSGALGSACPTAAFLMP
jgi:hypothetical protein